MAFRKLDHEEKQTLSEMVLELSKLHRKTVLAYVVAYSYDWSQLATDLREAIKSYKGILRKKDEVKG